MAPRWLILIIVALSLPFAAAVTCTSVNTPRLTLEPLSATIAEGQWLNGSLAIANKVQNSTVGTTLLTEQNTLFRLDTRTGKFSYTPNTTANQTRILFFAVSPDGCVGTSLAIYTVLHPPAINATPSTRSVTLQEGTALRFTAQAAGVTQRWALDNATAGGGDSYLFTPDFNDAGSHELSFILIGENGLVANRTWDITVINVNRPPIRIARVPGAFLPLKQKLILNLSYYFLDPDRTQLTYTARVDYPGKDALVEPANLSVLIEGEIATIEGLSPGKGFVTFIATDAGNASAEGYMADYAVANTTASTKETSCGDTICLGAENCSTCSPDCGKCEAPVCTPHWSCTDWGLCQPSGFRFSSCAVTNGCENATLRPPVAEQCDYNATCSDNIRNGNEAGVDCGGSCAPCPSCSDSIKNQGEAGVDCGGPCAAPFPSCNDSVQNQGESDIDCGGPNCPACEEGRRCLRATDCQGLVCSLGTCLNATCSDHVRNQGEARIDCGGPCTPCPSCSDRIQNQGETGVDCGGPCPTCPSCSDRIQNQGEKLVDCGGPCRQCVLRDYIPLVIRVMRWVLLAFLVLAAVYLLRAVFASRMLFLFRNKKAIHFFYEDPPTYALVKAWNSLARHFRLHRRRELGSLANEAYDELLRIRGTPREGLRAALAGKLRGLYASMFNLPPGFEFDQLLATVKHGPLPFSVKVIVLKNTKLLALLELTRLYGDASFALEEALRDLDDLRTAF